MPVTVTKESPQAVDIDIFSDWDKVSKDASIGGTITYQGDWPEDTELLLLVVYRQQPTDALSLLFFENIDYTQSLFVDSSEYRLLVSGAEYQYVVLFWVGKNISDFEDLIELGFYENPQQPGQPGIVDLREGGDATDIDISVNFNNVIFPK